MKPGRAGYYSFLHSGNRHLERKTPRTLRIVVTDKSACKLLACLDNVPMIGPQGERNNKPSS
jgi:hypothetical protein